MQPESEKSKKAGRRHVTTACVPCRESKIRCDGASPHCRNCQRKGKECKYQHGDDKRKVSLRAATELFSARIDQLYQFIHDNGLEPPSMNPEDESGMNRVLDTLQISRREIQKKDPEVDQKPPVDPSSPIQRSPAGGIGASPPSLNGQLNRASGDMPVTSSPAPQNIFSNPSLFPPTDKSPDADNPFALNPGPLNSYSWGFTLPTAESLDRLYANLDGGGSNIPADTNSMTPDSLHLSQDIAQQPGVLLEQARFDMDYDSDSGEEEEDEAEKDVIDQISHRIGTLKIAGDGHLRFYGATSNLNLVDVSATQQRQRPDARTVRHDGQDILNHLRVGQPVGQELEDHLVELYFTWQNPTTYVVDKDMYMTARSKWRDELDDTPFYSEVLTNAMCSIGSAFEARYHPTFITFPKSLSEFFADRAKALLEIELDSPCVATVQALVILSCHEGSSNRDARGWLYSGMSMRLAFDLGLHLDTTAYVEKGEISTFEADVRRVAFWGSYTADHFWGFYLGRPFRMSTGDINVPKPASDIAAEKEGTWYPYGLQTKSAIPLVGLKNPNELISRQFAILWEIISPVGHILYGCSEISRHDLQRLCYRVTEDLFAWKANLPSTLEIDPDDDTAPKLPHLLMLHMQYHQIVIFTHRPWVSKNYIQPRSPRQGPGYHHARRMCIESSLAVSRLLHLYEKHYTFRRMNNQVVAIIFSAALMLLYVTISPGKSSNENGSSNVEMVAYLNLCFRALDELGQSFENAKRTRDFLVSLQRRWQAHMRRSGSAKKRQMGNLLSSQPPAGQGPLESDMARKRSRLSIPNNSFPLPTTSPPTNTAPISTQTQTQTQTQPQAPQPIPPHSSDQTQQQPFAACQPGDIDWIRNSDLQLLSENLSDNQFPPPVGVEAAAGAGNVTSYAEASAIPSLADIEPWWDSPNGTTTFGGSSL